MILMGVVNLTPDSFRPETRAMSLEAARARIADLVARGCSIIDFGAVSTRPGAVDVPVEEEWRRLEPVLRDARMMGIPSAPTETNSSLPAISIDTTSSEIVRRVERLVGRFLVNDISAGEDDPAMLETVAELGLPYVAMHKRGNPRSMDALTDYPQGIVKAVDEYFEGFAAKAEALGIKDWILDPGFGFAKTAEQNWELLENLPALRHFGRPILVGVADKRFTHTPNPFGSCQNAEQLAAERRADILRIH
ncbi:MAG: dihydropteroate synthase [Bacteroidales bacterium]|nr:dihydropteroate synthase [Bacteroidales bacterium]